MPRIWHLARSSCLRKPWWQSARNGKPVLLGACVLGWLACAPLGYALQPQKKYNLRFKDLYLNLAGTFDIEYNDNITSSGTKPLQDIILKPGVIVEAEWRSGDIHQVQTSFGMHYDKYLRNANLDSANNLMNFDRNSQLQYSMRLKPVTITLRDLFSFSSSATDAVGIDPNTQQLIRNVSSYSRFDNKLILAFDKKQKNFSHNLSLSRQDVIPFQSQFSFTRRTEYAQTWTTYYTRYPTFIPGIQAGLSQNRYAKTVQNDSNGFNWGPVFQWKASNLVTITGAAIFSVTTFKPTGTTADASNSRTANLSLQIQHVVNRYYTHSLNLMQTTGYGLVSNTTRVQSAEYANQVRLNKRVTLKGSLKYEKSQDSGGLLAESFRRNTLSLSIEYILFKFGQLRAEIYHSRKSSNYADRSFPNTRFLIGIKYDF